MNNDPRYAKGTVTEADGKLCNQLKDAVLVRKFHDPRQRLKMQRLITIDVLNKFNKEGRLLGMLNDEEFVDRELYAVISAWKWKNRELLVDRRSTVRMPQLGVVPLEEYEAATPVERARMRQ